MWLSESTSFDKGLVFEVNISFCIPNTSLFAAGKTLNGCWCCKNTFSFYTIVSITNSFNINVFKIEPTIEIA